MAQKLSLGSKIKREEDALKEMPYSFLWFTIRTALFFISLATCVFMVVALDRKMNSAAPLIMALLGAGALILSVAWDAGFLHAGQKRARRTGVEPPRSRVLESWYIAPILATLVLAASVTYMKPGAALAAVVGLAVFVVGASYLRHLRYGHRAPSAPVMAEESGSTPAT